LSPDNDNTVNCSSGPNMTRSGPQTMRAFFSAFVVAVLCLFPAWTFANEEVNDVASTSGLRSNPLYSLLGSKKKKKASNKKAKATSAAKKAKATTAAKKKSKKGKKKTTTAAAAKKATTAAPQKKKTPHH